MYLLNSSGLLVDVRESVPMVTLGNWHSPSWSKGASVDPPNVTVLLPNNRFTGAGLGWFDLEGVSGVRGTVSVSLVVGAPGTVRDFAIITSNRTTLSPRMVLSVDGLNRPLVELQDSLGVTVASTMASYTPILEGSLVTLLFSWDATQAIEGLRFAKLRVQSGSAPSNDWVVAPTTAWSAFVPTSVGLGSGSGANPEFNGQILSLQISNEVVPSPDALWAFPSTHTLDCFVDDSVFLTDRSILPYMDVTQADSSTVSDSVSATTLQ